MVVAGSRPIPVGDQTPWIRARTDAGNTFGSLSNHASVSWTAKCCRKREPPTRRSNSVLAQSHLPSVLRFGGNGKRAPYKSRRPMTAMRCPESRTLRARWAKLLRYSELPEKRTGWTPTGCESLGSSQRFRNEHNVRSVYPSTKSANFTRRLRPRLRK
jgi:hypothetical protein